MTKTVPLTLFFSDGSDHGLEPISFEYHERLSELFEGARAMDIVGELVRDYEGTVVGQFKYIGPPVSSASRRVQYGETDFEFMCWILADAGLTFYHSPTWIIHGDTAAPAVSVVPV